MNNKLEHIQYFPNKLWCDISVFLMCPDVTAFSRKFLNEIGKYSEDTILLKGDLFDRFRQKIKLTSASSLLFSEDSHVIFFDKESELEIEIKLMEIDGDIQFFIIRDLITKEEIINWNFRRNHV